MKVVIIGFGNIAKKHLEVLKELGADVIASSNRSDKGNRLAKEYGIGKTYLKYEEMIEEEQPEAIINCVPFEQIYEVTKKLIPYKIPILIEKPAGTSVHELEDLIELQEQYGTIVQVALNRRHYSVIDNAIKNAGGLENITSVNVEWSETPLRLLHDKGYSHNQVAKMLYGNSIHGIDMMTYFSGILKNYTCYTSDKGDDFRWLMNVNGISESGVLANFNSSWDNPVPWRLVMTTEKKRYLFAPLETCTVQEDGVKELRSIEPEWYDKKYKAGFYIQMKTFLKGNEISNKHSLKSTKEAMSIAENIYNRMSDAND